MGGQSSIAITYILERTEVCNCYAPSRSSIWEVLTEQNAMVKTCPCEQQLTHLEIWEEVTSEWRSVAAGDSFPVDCATQHVCTLKFITEWNWKLVSIDSHSMVWQLRDYTEATVQAGVTWSGQPLATSIAWPTQGVHCTYTCYVRPRLPSNNLSVY